MGLIPSLVHPPHRSNEAVLSHEPKHPVLALSTSLEK